MQAYKSKVAVEWIEYIKANHPNWSAKMWQKEYYERIIRVGDLDSVRSYIRENPDRPQGHPTYVRWEKFYERMGWDKRPAISHKRDGGQLRLSLAGSSVFRLLASASSLSAHLPLAFAIIPSVGTPGLHLRGTMGAREVNIAKKAACSLFQNEGCKLAICLLV